MSDEQRNVKALFSTISEEYGPSAEKAARFILDSILPARIRNIQQVFEGLTVDEATEIAEGMLWMRAIVQNSIKSLLLSHTEPVAEVLKKHGASVMVVEMDDESEGDADD